MTKPEYTDEQKLHHFLGIELNMQTWNLLGMKNRKDKDDARMIAFAKGSLYHWLKSPLFKPINEQRGDWMISHVYAVLGKGEQALAAAEKSLAINNEHGFVDFDLGYTMEGMARAYAACNNKEKANEFYIKAKEIGETIKKDGDKKLFKSDLVAGPWYDCIETS
jgi:tetratricopeptide (TPR) repeat protein